MEGVRDDVIANHLESPAGILGVYRPRDESRNKKKVLTGEIADYCWKLFNEITDKYEFQIAEMEIMPDYVHLFVTAHPKKAPGKQSKNILKVCLKNLVLRACVCYNSIGKLMFAERYDMKILSMF